MVTKNSHLTQYAHTLYGLHFTVYAKQALCLSDQGRFNRGAGEQSPPNKKSRGALPPNNVPYVYFALLKVKNVSHKEFTDDLAIIMKLLLY